MKHIRSLLSAYSGVNYLVIVLVSLFLMAGSCKSPTGPYTVFEHGCDTIDTTQANVLFKQYYTRALSDTIPDTMPIKAIVINRDQLLCINALDASLDPKPKGYRIYYGLGEDGTETSMIVGINEKDEDICIYDDRWVILQNNERMWGKCPYLCDNNSPITRGTE